MLSDVHKSFDKRTSAKKTQSGQKICVTRGGPSGLRALICRSPLTYNKYGKIEPIQDFSFRNVDYDGGKRCHNNALTAVQPRYES